MFIPRSLFNNLAALIGFSVALSTLLLLKSADYSAAICCVEHIIAAQCGLFRLGFIKKCQIEMVPRPQKTGRHCYKVLLSPAYTDQFLTSPILT